MPTRLLDWSGNPLVAMFFACERNEQHATNDAAVWLLAPGRLNHLSFSSRFKDWISPLKSSEAAPLFRLPFHPEFAKPQDSPQETTFTASVLAVTPQEVHPRIQLQGSRFTIHATGQPLEESHALEPHRWLAKIRIPASDKPKMLLELSRLGFNRASLFQDLDSLASAHHEHMQAQRGSKACFECGSMPVDLWVNELESETGGRWLCTRCGRAFRETSD